MKNIERSKTIRIDAANRAIGRTASAAAHILLGKHLPNFERHKVSETRVIIENADQAIFTGKKLRQKNYYRHSGRLGNLKTIPLADLFHQDPGKVVRIAIRGMLPKNRLLKTRLKRLTIIKGEK